MIAFPSIFFLFFFVCVFSSFLFRDFFGNWCCLPFEEQAHRLSTLLFKLIQVASLRLQHIQRLLSFVNQDFGKYFFFFLGTRCVGLVHWKFEDNFFFPARCIYNIRPRRHYIVVMCRQRGSTWAKIKEKPNCISYYVILLYSFDVFVSVNSVNGEWYIKEMGQLRLYMVYISCYSF